MEFPYHFLVMKKYFAFILLFSGLFAAPMSWESPTMLSNPLADASDPQIAMDENGNIAAAWIEDGTLKASVRASNGNWEAAETLSGAGSSSPRIGFDSSGAVHAVWLEGGVVEYAAHPLGGSWSAPVALSDGGASSPRIAVNENGDAASVWIRGGIVEAKTMPAGGSWSSVSLISGADSDHAEVAINGNGAFIAVWRATMDGNHAIASSSGSISNGIWGAVKTIASAEGFNDDYPSVSIDPRGTAYAIWYHFIFSNSLFTNVTALGTYLSSGENWSLPISLSLYTGMRNPADLRNKVVVDSFSNAIGLWSNSYDGSSFSIETAILQGGQLRKSSTLVDRNDYAFQGDVSASGEGDALAVFMQFDAAATLIQAQETNLGSPSAGYWSSVELISTGTQNGYPRIAAKRNGNTVFGACLWLSGEGGKTIVRSSRALERIDRPSAERLRHPDE